MIFVPFWPKNEISLWEHDFSNFVYFPDTLKIAEMVMRTHSVWTTNHCGINGLTQTPLTGVLVKISAKWANGVTPIFFKTM